MNKNENVKFPKSQSGLQCLSPCYPADLSTIHPLTLRYYKSNFPYCHVTYKVGDNPNEIDDIDRCYNPISIDDYSKLSVDVLIPLIDFNCKHFLLVFNDIKTLNDGMEYLEKKKYTSVNTRARVINCIFKIHGESIEVVDQRLVDFIIEIIKKKWIVQLYDRVNQYIFVDEKEIKFVDSKNNDLNYNDYKVERINYIITKFVNYDEIYKFINKFISYRKEIWDSIENYIEYIKNDFINYVENKIIASLS